MWQNLTNDQQKKQQHYQPNTEPNHPISSLIYVQNEYKTRKSSAKGIENN